VVMDVAPSSISIQLAKKPIAHQLTKQVDA
jgi:hypothetical protein